MHLKYMLTILILWQFVFKPRWLVPEDFMAEDPDQRYLR